MLGLFASDYSPRNLAKTIVNTSILALS